MKTLDHKKTTRQIMHSSAMHDKVISIIVNKVFRLTGAEKTIIKACLWDANINVSYSTSLKPSGIDAEIHSMQDLMYLFGYVDEAIKNHNKYEANKN